ncbi:D-aminoacylase [Chitinophaga agrisoli]|uniref:D-aminoacylase n=1 Tax=Chitinophaga agrisoli TaxID=2607653 RepID=A0A5B2VKG8_9BACT|nr:D-aminoacylase [Chitinophaga agrisoli]KAA2238739.1 D-aminoacylase [Chitinophaga agrisoli]
MIKRLKNKTPGKGAIALTIGIQLLFTAAAFAQQSCDVLIRNGRIVDGTGNSWFYGDVAVKDGKILAVGKLSGYTAAKEIDAKKMIVAPGFIDVHGHVESGIFDRPTADNYIYDGVTTIVTGNCGSSARDLQQFFSRLDSLHPGMNIASLIGHNTVREQVMHRDNRAPTPAEQQQMEALVAKAMEDGAVGFSTGLIYIPGAFSKTDEVVGLAKASAKYNGVYASHIRNEENTVVDAVNEAISIGKAANMPVEISHFKVSGKANWGRSHETLNLVTQARKEGWDVTIDQYPYTASSTNLGVRLPDWALAGGQDSVNARLHNPAIRAQIKKEMLEQLHDYKYKNYSYCVVANYSADSTYNGKSITDINKLMGRKSNAKNEAETIMDMIEKGGAQMVYHGMDEKDVRYIMEYPFCMVGADAGVPTPGKGMPHPRAYGSNARILGRYVREAQLIPLEEAIRRMTSLAAQKFQLKDRGLLREGMAADIVIFDEQQIIDKATFDVPHQYSTGFQYVLVNGQLELENGQHTGVRSGMPLYGPAKKMPVAHAGF